MAEVQNFGALMAESNSLWQDVKTRSAPGFSWGTEADITRSQMLQARPIVAVMEPDFRPGLPELPPTSTNRWRRSDTIMRQVQKLASGRTCPTNDSSPSAAIVILCGLARMMTIPGSEHYREIVSKLGEAGTLCQFAGARKASTGSGI